MPDFLPIGSRVRYTADYNFNLLAGGINPRALVSSLGKSLPEKWSIIVEDGHGSGAFASASSIELRLRLERSYGKLVDVEKIVNGEILRAGVKSIFGSRVVGIALPGQGEQTTGATAPSVPPPGQFGEGFLKAVKTGGLVIVGGLVALAVIVVVVAVRK